MIGSDIGLLFRASGDTSDAKKAFESLKDSINKDSKQIKSDVEGSSSGGAAGLGKFAGAAGIAAGALAGLATVAVTVGTTLFNLAKNASDFGSQIFDASQKTGVGAESLSALKLAADQSGSSLEQVTTAISKFSRLIGEAAQGSEKARETLVRLGIDPKKAIDDLDGTLAIVFKRIAEAKNPIEATTIATQVFGKAGADIIPVIKSFDGDMAGLIKRAKELGVTLSDVDAAAADEFGDSLDSLKSAASGLGMTFAREFMPQITGAMKDITKFVTENKAMFKLWGSEVASVLAGVRSLFSWFSSADGQFTLTAARTILNIATGGVGPVAPMVILPPTPPKVSGKGDAENTGNLDMTRNSSAYLEDKKAREEQLKQQREARDKMLAALKTTAKLEIETERQKFEQLQDNLEAALENRSITFDQWKDLTLRDLGAFSNNVRFFLGQAFKLDTEGKTGQELLNAKKTFALELKKFEAEIDKQKAEVSQKRIETEKKAAEELKKTTSESEKIAEDAAKRKQALDDARRETGLAKFEAAERSKTISETTSVKAQAAIKLLALQSERAELQKTIGGLEAYSEKWNEVQNELLILDEKIAKQRIANSTAITEAIKKEIEAREVSIGRDREASEAQGDGTGGDPGGGGGGFLEGLGGGLGTSVLADGLDEAGNAVLDFGNAWQTLGDMAGNAIKLMAEGVGQMVTNMVLLGDLGGQSFRKLVASVLAGVASQAAVLAVMELAYGIAALTPWGAAIYGPAPLHFKAAALFGSIALIAGVAGRLVAGDSFKGNEAASGANSGAYGKQTDAGSGGDVYSSNRDKQILDMSRNTSAAVPETVININDRSGLFGEFFTIEVGKGGKTRDAIRKLID